MIDDLIAEAFDAPIRGWDFSWLDGRGEETRPPWNYSAIVREAAASSNRMLDVDTGGGEFLAGLAPFPGSAIATEGYGPNVGVARERLLPLGITVVETESAPDNVEQGDTDPASVGSQLPFADATFDLVIDRHSSYWPYEVYRVLSRGGRFITQQRSEAGTAGHSWEELFDRTRPDPHGRFDAAFAAAQLETARFEIVRAEEADTPMTFFDVAAVVYYLRIVPWAVEGFDPVADRSGLERVSRLIAEEGRLEIRGSHMLLDALRR